MVRVMVIVGGGGGGSWDATTPGPRHLSQA